MARRVILILAALFFLTIAQTGFIGHFKPLGAFWLQIINPAAVFIFIFSLFEKRNQNLSFLAAVWTGILLDLYSEEFFGLWIISLVCLVFAIKILKRYVSIPSFW